MSSEQSQFVGHGLYKVLKAFHRDAGPCWLQCFPQLCQFDLIWSWQDVLWVVDHSWYTRETVALGNPSIVVVLDTLKPVRVTPTTITVQRHFYLLSCPFILRMAHMYNSCLYSLKASKSFLNLSPPLHLHWYHGKIIVYFVQQILIGFIYSYNANSPMYSIKVQLLAKYTIKLLMADKAW